MSADTNNQREFVRASQGRRLANLVIDYLFAIAFIFLMWFGIVLLAAVVGGDISGLLEFEFLINIVGYAAFYILFEGSMGRTPAKFLTGTIVVSETNGRPSIEQIIGRTLVRLVPFEPFSFFGSKASGWHDRWSGTKVVLKQTSRDAENSDKQLSVPTTASVAASEVSEPANQRLFVVNFTDGNPSAWVDEKQVLEWYSDGKIDASTWVYPSDNREWFRLKNVFELPLREKSDSNAPRPDRASSSIGPSSSGPGVGTVPPPPVDTITHCSQETASLSAKIKGMASSELMAMLETGALRPDAEEDVVAELERRGIIIG